MKVGGLTNMICKRIGAKYSKFVKICAPEGWREGFNSDGLDNLEKPGWMFWTALWGALYLVGSMFPYVPFVNGRYADVLLSEIGFFCGSRSVVDFRAAGFGDSFTVCSSMLEGDILEY